MVVLVLLAIFLCLFAGTKKNTTLQSKEFEMKSSQYYTVKSFEIIDKEEKLVNVILDNNGTDGTIEVSYNVRIDGFYALENERNYIKGTNIAYLNAPNYIRFSEDIDREIRTALNQ